MLSPESESFDQWSFNCLCREVMNAASVSDLTESRRLCSAMLEMHPEGGINRGIALYILGRLEIASGNREEGIRILEESIRIFPANFVSYCWLNTEYRKKFNIFKIISLKIKYMCNVSALQEEYERQAEIEGVTPFGEWLVISQPETQNVY